MKPLRAKKTNVYFRINIDYIDAIAAALLPADGPRKVDAIKTGTDGNCLCHALSRSHCGDESMHLELRARIVIEGFIHKKFYLSDESLSRGATSSRNEP